MPHPDFPPDPATLAACWREDARVFRRHGATGRARMLERIAEALEQSTRAPESVRVDLATATERSGFTRGHLRRLIRTGKLPASINAAGEPEIRLADLPRKAGLRPAAAELACEPRMSRRAVVEVLRNSS
jgi:hypothetical protein